MKICLKHTRLLNFKILNHTHTFSDFQSNCTMPFMICLFAYSTGFSWFWTSYLLCRGKMGASLHRQSKSQAIGGKPPYLMVFFIFVPFHPSIIVEHACCNMPNRSIWSYNSLPSLKNIFLFLLNTFVVTCSNRISILS